MLFGSPSLDLSWKERLRRLRLSETQRFLLLSTLIGIFAGLTVVCFHVSISFAGWDTLGSPPGQDVARTIFWPMAGGLFASLLLWRIFPEASGSGINQTKAAIYISEGYVPFKSVVGKFLACSVSIGSGNSLGPEDPSLHMGAGIASLLGRAFRLSRENLRHIAPVGAAAGIGAAFNTPITGVLFVMEEVLGGWKAGVLGSIVLASVSAVVVSRSFLGDQPLFRVPAIQSGDWQELAVFAVLGLASGLLSVAFVRSTVSLRSRFRRIPTRYRALRPLAGGLAVGLVGLWLPEVMGVGYDSVDSALHYQYTWQKLGLLVVAKIVVTMLCFGAGTPGGMFAPTLFIGAMLGGVGGTLAQLYWPFPSSSLGAYVLVGMGAFFVGVFRTPMTSIFMVFEVSGTYVTILPVMVANVLSYLLARHWQREPFLDQIAHEEGLDLPSLEDEREQRILRVEDAMKHNRPLVLPAGVAVLSALSRLHEQGVAEALITRSGNTWAWVSAGDLETAAAAGWGGRLLEHAFTLRRWPRVFPDTSLDTALRHLGRFPLLPVLNRAAPAEVLGTLELDDVHRAYGLNDSSAAASDRPASYTG